MSKANQEQIFGIEHHGNVLLSAGAGSGKTFVLVEHVIYLIEKIYKDKDRDQDFETSLRQFFSSMVMMTFTNKAAGEMSIRLNQKIQNLILETNELKWKVALEQLPWLQITTIDGFCRKLISQGFFPDIPQDIEIISEIKKTKLIEDLIDRWLDEKSLPEKYDEVFKREKNGIKESLVNVFLSPEERLNWEKFDISDLSESSLFKTIFESYKLNSIDQCLTQVFSFEELDSSSPSTFEKSVISFKQSQASQLISREDIEEWAKFFQQLGTLRGESPKKKTPLHEAVLDSLKKIREWSKEWSEVLGDYHDYKNEYILWINECVDLFQYINDRLYLKDGLTFGDVEYFVAKGLDSIDLRQSINERYKYFIVDEFQDTSHLQFQIIKNLINNDYTKLFCVGDPKQAIYGFRGGELSVFENCLKKMKNNYTLKMNYRSEKSIIEFNNTIFDKVLASGLTYSGDDQFSVKYEDQICPKEIDNGEIRKLKLSIEDLPDEKLSTSQIHQLEAEIFCSDIQKRLNNLSKGFCILYSKLNPSQYLIREFIKNKMSFSAQFKFFQMEEPIITLFVLVLKRDFDKDHGQVATTLISHFLQLIEVFQDECDLSDLLKTFDLDKHYWGFFLAFEKMLKKLSFTNENFDLNLELIKTLFEIHDNNLEEIFRHFNLLDDHKISLNLRYGLEPNNILIMTAHASKGLQFENVYLGGIHTNGRDQGERGFFGTLPHSSVWFKDHQKREKFKSPWFVHEIEIAKFKNFSESKRLFYVACTRAMTSLSYLSFDEQIPYSVLKNSWASGLAFAEGELGDNVNLKTYGFHLSSIKNNDIKNLPLYFFDSMGIYQYKKFGGELSVTPELSVTRLNDLVSCPRKFYFSQVIKLESESSDITFDDDVIEDEIVNVKSSAERGTRLHEAISEMIRRNFHFPRRIKSENEKNILGWIKEMLNNLDNSYQLISEKTLKFKLFNFMISGTPDLVLISQGEKMSEIWDFKTGMEKESHLEKYFFQLECYALALFDLALVPKNQKIVLKLIYLDEKNILMKEVDYQLTHQKVFEIWKKQNQPWLINLDHCTQCSYGDICPK